MSVLDKFFGSDRRDRYSKRRAEIAAMREAELAELAARRGAEQAAKQEAELEAKRQAVLARLVAQAEPLVRSANESLRLANRSRNIASRRARTLIARDYLRRIREFSAEYPFMTLQQNAEFEDSIRKVEEETAHLEAGRPITVEHSEEQSLPIRIRLVAQVVNDEIVPAKGTKLSEFVAILINFEPADDTSPGWKTTLTLGEGAAARDVTIDLAPLITSVELSQSMIEPILARHAGHSIIIFRSRLFVPERKIVTLAEYEEVILRAKKLVYEDEVELNSIKSTVSNLEAAIEFQRTGPKREPIPDHVKTLVWGRDGGVCVRCGSAEKLHFDHIIPVVKGGSSDEVNIQLLCQPCNLRKSDKIAF